MVATKILDEALRGGETARILEDRCQARMVAAEQALQQAVDNAPKYIAESKVRHDEILNEGSALMTELDMLGDSLDDITKRSREIMERAQLDSRKKAALDELTVAIVPFVKVADALKISDNLGQETFLDLQRAHAAIMAAKATARDFGPAQLSRIVPELEERADEAIAMMKSRYTDTFEVHPQRIIARGKPSTTSRHLPGSVGDASSALMKAGLLEEAMSGILSELIRNEVARRISEATVFFESELQDEFSLEWSTGAESSAELLEFDLDDVDIASDVEIDAMSEHLDIANTAARALKIYDVLCARVVGKDFSRELAFALQPWFSEHVLPSSVVLSSNRASYAEGGIPREALRSRVTAVSACAKVIQTAMQTRGVTSFVLIVEMDSLESKVGSECRGQAVLSARRAISSFANAWHDDNEMITCPISSNTYIPREKQSPEYMAPCLVTRAANTVHDIFLSTRKDAIAAMQCGSVVVGEALNAAALECLRAYREDVPLQHASELRASLRLKALYYNDCMMFAKSCMVASKDGHNHGMEAEVSQLEEAATKAMMVVRRTAEQRLIENLNAACRNGSLGAYGTLIRIQRSSALSAAFNAMREVVKVFAEIVPTELAELAAGRLLNKYISTLCDEIAALPDISADGCEQIDGILQEADENVDNLMNLVSGMEIVRAGAQPPEVIHQMRTSQNRLRAIREILSSRMEDIATAFRSGKYDGLITRQEAEHFIRGIFEDTALRASFIADLDISLEQETGEWENSNW